MHILFIRTFDMILINYIISHINISFMLKLSVDNLVIIELMYLSETYTFYFVN